jgi:hypothetical protein
MTTKHALIKIVRNADSHDLTIVSVHDNWTTAIGAWEAALAAEDTRRAAGGEANVFYSVRDADHELTIDAATQMADKLTPREIIVLEAVWAAKPNRPRGGWAPGSRKVSDNAGAMVGSLYSADAHAPARRLEAKGLMVVRGVAYGTKTYYVTPVGRIVARAV